MSQDELVKATIKLGNALIKTGEQHVNRFCADDWQSGTYSNNPKESCGCALCHAGRLIERI